MIEDIKREDYDLVEYHTLVNARDAMKLIQTEAFKNTITAIENAIKAMA